MSLFLEWARPKAERTNQHQELYIGSVWESFAQSPEETGNGESQALPASIHHSQRGYGGWIHSIHLMLTQWESIKMMTSETFQPLFSSFSAAATVDYHQALCQWESDVQGWIYQQRPDQDWGGVVRQRCNTTVLPIKQVSIWYQNYITSQR